MQTLPSWLFRYVIVATVLWMTRVVGLMFLLTVTVTAQLGTFQHKGVNFTAEGRGGYGGETATAVLKELPEYGVNAIALVPYGMTRRGGTTIRFGGMERDADVVRVAVEARRLGIKVMLKPQIWVPGGFTGDLDFPNDADRMAWFEQYRTFIIHHAEIAAKAQADVFCVGTELSKLSTHEAEWRRIIKDVGRSTKEP